MLTDKLESTANKQSKFTLELKQIMGEMQSGIKETQDIPRRLDQAASQANSMLSNINEMTISLETLEQTKTGVQELLQEWQGLASTVMSNLS